MEAAGTSEMSVNFCETTRRNIPEDSQLSSSFGNVYWSGQEQAQITVLVLAALIQDNLITVTTNVIGLCLCDEQRIRNLHGRH
jgi:hypothetical protein